MSGGSFDYMYQQDEPRRSLVEQMLEELAKLADEKVPGALEAYDATSAYLRPTEDPVRQVWRAIEWWRSADYGKEEVIEALADFEEERASQL